MNRILVSQQVHSEVELRKGSENATDKEYIRNYNKAVRALKTKSLADMQVDPDYVRKYLSNRDKSYQIAVGDRYRLIFQVITYKNPNIQNSPDFHLIYLVFINTKNNLHDTRKNWKDDPAIDSFVKHYNSSSYEKFNSNIFIPEYKAKGNLGAKFITRISRRDISTPSATKPKYENCVSVGARMELQSIHIHGKVYIAESPVIIENIYSKHYFELFIEEVLREFGGNYKLVIKLHVIEQTLASRIEKFSKDINGFFKKSSIDYIRYFYEG